MSERAELFEAYQGKSIFLHLNSGRKYNTSNLLIIGEYATFTDKFGCKVTIALSEILRIEEVAR